MEKEMPNFKRAKVKVEDYLNDATVYVIHGWMIKRLKLKGNEKDIFAIIHGFSQNENGYFYGSKAYLAKCASCDVSTVKKVLMSLTKKGLITKCGKEYTGSDQRVYYISNVDPEKVICCEHTLDTYKKLAEEIEKSKIDGGGKNNPGENNPSYNNPGLSDFYPRTRVNLSHNSINNIKLKNNNVVVDEERFLNAIELQKSRYDEADRTDEYSNKAVQYAIDSFNCFGEEQIAKINKLSQSAYESLFDLAYDFANKTGEYKDADNPKKVFSSMIKRYTRNISL